MPILFAVSEWLTGIKDLENVVVKNRNGSPVLVRDVAEVREGIALRYGASTKDGKGEIVCGMVLMLKGENSSAVVDRIKEKMIQINKSLPEGVVAEAFIDRGKLVDNAIGTVTKNLLEGALIVIFVLILFLRKSSCRFNCSICNSVGDAFCCYFDECLWRKRKFNEFGRNRFWNHCRWSRYYCRSTMHHLQKLKRKKELSQERNG